MIDPQYQPCMERGFIVFGDSCQFPDGTFCDLEAFNAQECGKEWYDKPFCVPEGGYVWNGAHCCEGLEAYLPEGVDGQATCQLAAASVSETISPIWVALILVAIAGLIPLGRRIFRK